jgi:ABC-type lipoprotein export system ATPase subunit
VDLLLIGKISDLDEQTENEIMELFQKVHREREITLIMVSHTSQLVSYGTRWLEMAGGRIVRESDHSCGTQAELLNAVSLQT